MPKLNEAEQGREHIAAALENIKAAVPLSELYHRIHGQSPQDRQDERRFYNRFQTDRGNPSMGFLGVCVAHCPEIQGWSLKELFSLDKKAIAKPRPKAKAKSKATAKSKG